MSATSASARASSWLLDHGPKLLEDLLRAVIFHPAVPILIADSEGKYRDASVGAAKLLGVNREKLVGRRLTEFVVPAHKPNVLDLWQAFRVEGEQVGILPLRVPKIGVREVEFTAKAEILPDRHLLILKDKSEIGKLPAWVQDYALYLLDDTGAIAAWFAGAARVYGYSGEEVLGRHVACLYRPEESVMQRLQGEFNRASGSGYFATEGWQTTKDKSPFWASTITTALKDEAGELQGFARIVRNFSDRHEEDEKLARRRAQNRTVPAASTVVGIATCEFDLIPDVTDTFLDIIGYTREDAALGLIRWPELTPPEYAALDDFAHEESMRFGACTPFEKELIRKDGTRVSVLVTTAMLQLTPFRWISMVQDLSDRHRLESVEEEDHDLKQEFDEIVGASAALRRVQQQVEVVAPTDATVLILGETGTGKELVARAIHRMSPRRNMPFVTLNCAAIPTGLLESELFGYERGAFTGALAQKIGRFEMANRGTLFLDEVGDIPLDLQPKLLRALQEKSFERLGGIRTIPIDVRLVAATNRNLTEMMSEKQFRSDLYYRLKVFPITTPPLRDRPEDIPILARHFVRKYAEKMGRRVDKIPTETTRALVEWSWPGNVRELENFIERSVILTVGETLRAPLSEIRESGVSAHSFGSSTLEEVEREHILRILRECKGVVSTAATRLGLHRTTLNAMMRKRNISRKDFQT